MFFPLVVALIQVFSYVYPFFVAEQVTGGLAKVDVKFGIFTVFDKTLAPCDLAKQAGMTCPISAATQTVKVTENVPMFLFRQAKYNVYFI